ncbi:uncharacterized protein [Garra rufa]|uniref:uncharacterized protein n=1 Tax=Garra rufa TaxID=137080 RepID=UPI003CCE780B
MAAIKFMVYMTCFCLYQDLVLCDDYGESGSEITLTPSIRGKPEEILWTYKGNKVLEYDGSEVTKYGSFKGRVDVDFETGQLTIRRLNGQDSGKYQSEIWINRKVQIASHTLTVLDALPEPRVTCELDETLNVKKLSCSVESQTQPSYEWSGPDIKESGPTLLVDEQEEKHDSVYTCTVKNKAASRTTDFTLQDCHKVLLAGGGGPAVLVPVIIVTVLLIILLAVLALYFYRRKKQKSMESDRKKMDTENGECDNLLRNVPMETMPGSSDATLPCRTRLTAPKESIANKKWDHDTESENLGETHEGQKLLRESLQSAVTEKNKEDTGSTNEGELDKNEKNNKTEDADKNEDDQTPEDKKEKEEENKEIDNLNTGECDNLLRNVPMETMPGSSDATLPCRTRLTAPKESIVDKTWDHDTESENSGETHEGQKLWKESLQSAVTEKNKEDTGSRPTNEEQDKNEKNCKNENNEPEGKDTKTIESKESLQTQEEREKEKSQILKNESENEEKSHEEETETLGDQKTEDADKNEDDQTPEDKKEKEEENKEIDNLNTGESNNLLRNVPVETMPGSSDATLPCRTRLTAPKESIAGLENAGETYEGQKLLKESLQSEKNKEDTGNTNEGELDKDEKNGKNAGEAPEIINCKPDETDRDLKKQKSVQTQEEMNNENSPEDQNETLTDLESKDADKNDEGQTPGEKKEEKEQHKSIDSLNKETTTPQPAVTESTVDTGNVEEQLQTNENNSQNENVEQSPEQQNKSPCTDINEADQRQEEETAHKGIDRQHTDSPANLEKEPINISVPSSNQSPLSDYTDSNEAQTDAGSHGHCVATAV